MTKKSKVTFEEKRTAVFNHLSGLSRNYLASLCLALFYKKDVIEYYRENIKT